MREIIIQKFQKNQIIYKNICNQQDYRTQIRKKSLSKVQSKHNTIQKSAIDQQNRKRLQNYNLPQYNKQNRIQQDMSRSKIARLNEQIQERTQYYIQHSKFLSKFQQDHFQYRPSYLSNKRQISPTQSSDNKDFNSSKSRFNNKYKLQTPISSNFLNVPQPRIQQKSRFPRVTFADQYTPKPLNYNFPINYAQNIEKVMSEDEFHDLSDKKNILKYHSNQPKNVFKQQIKQNVKQNVNNIVGQQNQELLWNIGDSAGQIKNNAIQGFKDRAYDFQESLIATKNMVVQGARQSKQVAKQGIKDTTKAVVRTQNFQTLKYIKDAIIKIKNNIFCQPQAAKPQAKIQNSINKNSPNRRKVNWQSIENQDALNQVSPIPYSQRAFIKNSVDQLNFFWIYGLMFIALFLVFFQIIK